MSSNKRNEIFCLRPVFLVTLLLLHVITGKLSLSRHLSKSNRSRELMQYHSPLMNTFSNYMNRQSMNTPVQPTNQVIQNNNLGQTTNTLQVKQLDQDHDFVLQNRANSLNESLARQNSRLMKQTVPVYQSIKGIYLSICLS